MHVYAQIFGHRRVRKLTGRLWLTGVLYVAIVTQCGAQKVVRLLIGSRLMTVDEISHGYLSVHLYVILFLYVSIYP